MVKQVGLFGGTFNPVHKGHLWAARAVREEYRLDTVVLIPAAIPPHKNLKDVAPALDRLAMLQAAVAGEEGLSVSDVELNREGPSYTIDTLNYFSGRYPDTAFFFILGGDAFLEIDTWKHFRALFAAAPMIVLARPGAPFGERIGAFLRETVSAGYSPSGGGFCCPGLQTVHLFSGEMKPISSTLVRERIGRGESASDFVSPCTEAYILEKGLYQ